MDFGAGWWEGWVGMGGGVWIGEGGGVRSGWKGELDRVDGVLGLVLWGNLGFRRVGFCCLGGLGFIRSERSEVSSSFSAHSVLAVCSTFWSFLLIWVLGGA